MRSQPIDLRIIPNEKVSQDLISVYRKHFPAETSPFLVFGGKYDYRFDAFPNVTILPSTPAGVFRLFRSMCAADRIHIHGLYSFTLVMLLALFPFLGKKTVWYIFGDDLYCLTRPKGTLKNAVHLMFRRLAYSHIRYVSTDVSGDWLLLQDIMHKKYGFFPLRYSNRSVNHIQAYVSERTAPDVINILLGNSATATNHHIEAFQKLQKFGHLNLRIFAPLSYGDPAYRDEVIRAGQEMFGEKFIPLTDFLPKSEYFRFLAGMDMGVFAHDRQQGLDNIVGLLYAGARVFLKSDTTLYHSLHDEYHLPIENFYTIDELTDEQFSCGAKDVSAQRKLVLEMTDEERYVRSLADSMIGTTRLPRLSENDTKGEIK